MTILPGRTRGDWPHFFIVGAPKAGTTSLYQYLSQQPAIFLPGTKEPHYFSPQLARELDMEHVGTESEYLALFAGAGPDQLRGEASTGYLRSTEAAPGIKARAPDARIIILLREPGERAFSHYLMRWRAGGFRMSLADGLANHLRDDPEYRLFRQVVLEPGYYAAPVARFIDAFGREAVKTIIAEEFFANPRAIVEDTLAFLGISGATVSSTVQQYNDFLAPRGPLAMGLLRQKRHLRFLRPLVPAQLKWRIVRSVFNKPATKPALTPEERALLNQVYAEDVRATRALLGRPELWSDTIAAEASGPR